MNDQNLIPVSPPGPAVELLKALARDVAGALDAIRIPAFIVDSHRRIRWQNPASIELVGDLRGRLDGSVGLDPEDLSTVRNAFASKQEGAGHTEVEVCIPRPDGRRARVAVSSVPLRDEGGTMIGSFGLVRVVEELDATRERVPRLSPREHETLVLLARGYSTTRMAEEMHISKETVRNHVKGLLRNLGARSRVEAVAKARRLGLV